MFRQTSGLIAVRIVDERAAQRVAVDGQHRMWVWRAGRVIPCGYCRLTITLDPAI